MTARALFIGLLAAALWLPAQAGAVNRELRVADTHPADYPTVQALTHMGKLLAERSQGRINLKVMHSRLMGEEAETIDHTRIGALDMARVNVAPLNDLVRETIVPSLPFLFRSIEHLHKCLDGPIGADLAKAFEQHGLIALAFYDSGARSFYNARHPIRRPGDLKGLRIRVQQSTVAEAMVTVLGATAAALPYGQVSVGLKAGLIDGAENNWPSYQTARHFEAAQFYSLSEHSMTPEVLIMSKKVWDGLAPAEQNLIREAAQDSVGHMRTLWAAREAAARQALSGAGVIVNPVDKAAFSDAMLPIYERFTAEPKLKDLLRRIQAVP
ncbi:MAG: TRAP transporter substrate-binding protein [Rhodospirillaceae bacterium]|nr:TRAP transporter substrate-binding protein [Rhodospirillales bacterium]